MSFEVVQLFDFTVEIRIISHFYLCKHQTYNLRLIKSIADHMKILAILSKIFFETHGNNDPQTQVSICAPDWRLEEREKRRENKIKSHSMAMAVLATMLTCSQCVFLHTQREKKQRRIEIQKQMHNGYDRNGISKTFVYTHSTNRRVLFAASFIYYTHVKCAAMPFSACRFFSHFVSENAFVNYVAAVCVCDCLRKCFAFYYLCFSFAPSLCLTSSLSSNMYAYQFSILYVNYNILEIGMTVDDQTFEKWKHRGNPSHPWHSIQKWQCGN